MNKAGIVDAIHMKLGGTKVQAEEVVDAMLESIVGTLKKGEEVSIAGLGIFSVKKKSRPNGAQSAHRRGGPSQGHERTEVPRRQSA